MTMRTNMVTMVRTTSSGLAGSGLLLGLLLGPTACNELEPIDDGGPAGGGIPAEVQRVFDERCSIPGCHDATRAGGLELTRDAAPDIIGGASVQSSLPLVELGNVQGSYLAAKLLPNSDALQNSRMPLGASLDDASVLLDNAIILGWIAGAELPGGGGGDGVTTDDPDPTGGGSTGDGDGSTGVAVVMCGLEDIAPTEPNPFDIGMDAGQIPPDIGAALTANCGCHEVDPMAVMGGAPAYGGQVHFSTIAEAQADFMGRPVYEVMLERLQSDDFSQMPPNYYCMVEGDSPITTTDQALLVQWLMAGAPDAATWEPGA